MGISGFKSFPTYYNRVSRAVQRNTHLHEAVVETITYRISLCSNIWGFELYGYSYIRIYLICQDALLRIEYNEENVD